jgi:hypothetical protein
MKMIKGFQKDLNNTKTKGGENRMLRLMKKTSFIFVVLVCLAVAGNASAGFVVDPNLHSYIDPNNGLSVDIGDKTFWGFSIGGLDLNSGAILNPVVLISGSQVGNVVSITFGQGFLTNGAVDYQLQYHVTSNGAPIMEIGQLFNFTGGNAGGSVNIGETAYDLNGNWAAQSTIFHADLGSDYNDPPGEPAQGDSLYINPALMSLWITKDINLVANEGSTSPMGATFILQKYYQQVPEPSTLLLLGTGFASLAFYARRKRQ